MWIVSYIAVWPSGQEAAAMAATAIRTEGLTKRYGDVAALDHLDLEVTQGEVVGYLGPNGAGDVTTLGGERNHGRNRLCGGWPRRSRLQAPRPTGRMTAGL